MYILDSDVLIQAHREYYSFSLCPAFWDWLVAEGAANRLASIDPVREELMKGRDELSEWAEMNPGFFRPIDSHTLSVGAPKTSKWARECTSPKYTIAAISDFFGKADFHLISFCLAHGHTLISREQTNNSAGRIMIGNACRDLKVCRATLFKALQESGVILKITSRNS